MVQWWAHVLYVGESEGEDKSSDDIMAFQVDFNPDEILWVYWSDKKGFETLKKAKAKLATIDFFRPGTGGTKEDSGYYQARIIAVARTKEELQKKMQDKHVRRLLKKRVNDTVSLALTKGRDDTVSLSSEESGRSSSSSSSGGTRLRSGGDSESSDIFNTNDYTGLSVGNEGGKNSNDEKFKSKIKEYKRRLSEVESQNKRLLELNMELQERERDNRNNCDHSTCRCGKTPTTPKTPSDNRSVLAGLSTGPKETLRLPTSRKDPGFERGLSPILVTPKQHSTERNPRFLNSPEEVQIETYQGVQFPDGTSGEQLYEVRERELVNANDDERDGENQEENTFGNDDEGDHGVNQLPEDDVTDEDRSDDEFTTIYDNIRIKTKHFNKVKEYLQNPQPKPAYGLKGDRAFVVQCSKHICGDKRLVRRTVTGRMANMFKSEKAKKRKVDVDPALHPAFIASITGVLKMRIMQELSSPVPEGLVRESVSQDKRMKNVNIFIGAARDGLLRRLRAQNKV